MFEKKIEIIKMSFSPFRNEWQFDQHIQKHTPIEQVRGVKTKKFYTMFRCYYEKLVE